MTDDIYTYATVPLLIEEGLWHHFVAVCARQDTAASKILHTCAVALMREWIRQDAEEASPPLLVHMSA